MIFDMDRKKAKLILEDGSVFHGYGFGAKNGVSGEVVFNTSMVGYPESMTDPSYAGQILVFTYPLIGNYGVPPEQKEHGLLKFFESDDIHTKGIIISDYSFEYSHFNAASSLDGWMDSKGVPGIYGIDTRELTKKLREKGTMVGKIIMDKDVPFEDPSTVNLVETVSIDKPVYYGDPKSKIRVLVIDCGVKYNILKSFIKRGCYVIRAPWNHDFSDMDYDALFISNGPGDPEICVETIRHIKKAMEEKNPRPVMGICLGNQLLGLAAGGKTHKLKYGHRSQNQPCIDLETGRCYITSQNHGYVLDTKTLPAGWAPWFVNANDDTNEGIKHKDLPFFSVQFHPEASPGPVDTDFLFDQFIDVIRRWKK